MLYLRKKHQSFGGWTEFYTHESAVTNSSMNFALYRPALAASKKLPLLYWLSGLTCTEENFMQKAGAQRYLAEHGIILVAPDTSPRNCGISGERDTWSFGEGASFYLNATQEPWCQHYRMFDYLTTELPALLAEHFPCDLQRQSIFGHSMGGHGALVLALRRPDLYRSVSAFAPITTPSSSAWGRYAFTQYLGTNALGEWERYDATALVAHASQPLPLLIDQGAEDEYLKEKQLNPAAFQEACQRSKYPLTLRIHPGYDHSYYFVASFIAEHIKFHSAHF